jgi:membrane-bound lytic murein transglycosylase D
MKMNRKNRWRILLPVIITAKVGIIIFLIMGSATDQKPEIVRLKTPAAYKSVEIPDTVSFAGELVPLGRFDVRESLDRELLVNSFFHSQTLRFIKLAPRYFAMIEPILKEKGVPEDFKYLAVAESGLNPRAISPARAIGFWQFLSGTARDYGLEVNSEVDERYHVEKSTYAACDYMLDAYKKYGSWSMVAASFNAGMNGIDRQLKRQKTNSYYDLLLVSETGRYVFRIIALKLVLENPAAYYFDVSEEEKYPVIPTRSLDITGSVEDFADFAYEQGINYKLLKDFNPWLRQSYLTNIRRKTYRIKIPVLE